MLRCLLLWLGVGGTALAQTPTELATQARAVFVAACGRCHANEESDYFDVRQLTSLKKQTPGNSHPYVTPGKLNESLLWEYIKDANAPMPKKKTPERDAFTDAQRNTIKKWIEAGAPAFPEEAKRPFIPLTKMLQAILDHANKAQNNELPYLRYFTLTHLHNNNTHITAAELRLTRAAVAKAVNSLTWAEELVPLDDVPGTDGTVLVVNINKLKWTKAMWNRIAQAYPYSLGYANHDDANLQALDTKLRKLFDGREELIHVRADWFVATVTRPPLYHTLLFDDYLPALVKRKDDPKDPANVKQMTAKDLEDFLGVNVQANLLAKEPAVKRAGFPGSGVSAQNRMIEAHPLGAGRNYWKSYDFKSSTWEANLQQFPLGPRFASNPFDTLGFKQDGGEIIFPLKNGLQGYLLIDANDRRIDTGPIEVVSDPSNNSGTPVIVNGVSCIACHKNGMRSSPADQVREGKGVAAEARVRVKQLYVPKTEMDDLIRREEKLFLDVLERTIGKFLRVDEASKKTPLTDFPEPASDVAKRYYAGKDDLDAATLAAELYIEDAQEIVRKAHSDTWKKLGLGALAVPGGKSKRGAWEGQRGTSQMQQAAREFGYSPR